MGQSSGMLRWRTHEARSAGARPDDIANPYAADRETPDDALTRSDATAEVAIVAAALADRAAFAPLYRRYAPEVYRFCLRRLRTREAAEDATSQIFIRVLASLGTFRGEAFAPWLFAIAHNTVINILRRRAEHTIVESIDLIDSAPGPEDAALAHDAAATLWRLLDHLPEDQRHVIELRLAGLRGPEIAVALGRSPGAVRMLQFRAMGHLREAFAQIDKHAANHTDQENDHDHR